MPRPITLFTGQWADLPFEEVARLAGEWGYDGLEIDLRECALVHPAFGLFDGAQWLLFVAVHAQQHRGQILDVRRACDASRSAGVR